MTALPELVAAVALALAASAAVLRPRWVLRFERPLLSSLRRPRSAVAWTLALSAATLLAEAATGLWVGLPEPRVHDEHSLLLQADTFLHGRLANPPPPHWRHFETFHILVHPTYAAKYPPAQAGVLALGRLAGHPVLGQWLAGVALVAAASWMLHAWLRPPWARLGALLIACNVVVGTWWSLGFTGPFAAAAAGALLLGAAERLRARPRALDGAILGTSLAALAASRPYEGLVLAVATLVPLGLRGLRVPAWRREALRRASLAAAVPLLAGLAFLAHYDHRVTGDALDLPFLVYDQRHARVPLFLWQPLRDTVPTNARMEAFYAEFELAAWRRQRTPKGWLAAAVRKPYATLDFYLQPGFLLGLLALPVALRRPRARRAAWTLAAVLASQLAIVPAKPHYVAPAAALIAYLGIECWRRVRLWRPGPGGVDGRAPIGRALALVMPLAGLLLVPPRLAELRPGLGAWQLARAGLQRRLERSPSPDLVLVSYDPRSSPHAEWVYNGADLATVPVLWARSLSPAEDCALVRSLPQRRPWRLEVVEEVTPPRLAPFPLERCAAGPAPAGASSVAIRPPRTAPAAPPPARAR